MFHFHIDKLVVSDGDTLRQILTLVTALQAQGVHMSAELDRLTTEVSENSTVIASAIALLNSLAQIIRDNAQDPAKLGALADELDAKQRELADAVTANTPAQP